MDAKTNSDPLGKRIVDALKHAQPNQITLYTSDGQTYRIHGDATLGHDFLEFQPENGYSKLILLPLDKIVRVVL
jgi:hypothetical protein